MQGSSFENFTFWRFYLAMAFWLFVVLALAGGAGAMLYLVYLAAVQT